MAIYRWFRFICIALGILVLPRWAEAFNFELSSSEFATWPIYCQARYASLSYLSSRFEFSSNFPHAIIEQQREELGKVTFERVHHWCAGMTWLNRARVETDPKVKAFQLTRVKDETLFTLSGLPSDSKVIPAMYVTLGSACLEQEDFQCAQKDFEKAIKINPAEATAYSALAILFRKKKELNLARDTLLRGNTAVGERSSEIQYNLGLILLEMNDIDGALTYAHKAYRAGYPLPGLKSKLKRLDRWTEPSVEGSAQQESVKPPR